MTNAAYMNIITALVAEIEACRKQLDTLPSPYLQGKYEGLAAACRAINAAIDSGAILLAI